jgi:hypothetical protein
LRRLVETRLQHTLFAPDPHAVLHRTKDALTERIPYGDAHDATILGIIPEANLARTGQERMARGAATRGAEGGHAGRARLRSSFPLVRGDSC